MEAEAKNVPFFPQEENYCGPAALATVLTWTGITVDPVQIAERVYTPDREGTLQSDILAAARREGRLAVPVGSLRDVMTEIAAGHPVLVLQNLGLDWYPQWHYAVVVGYDLEAGQLTLRSGEERTRLVALDTFARTWARADEWAIVVLPPATLSASAGEASMVLAAAGLERASRATDAALAYDTILDRWPDSGAALIGRGNARYAAGDLKGAAVAYRAALVRHPTSAAAWNNLADVLAKQGERAEAVIAARRAVALGGVHADTYRRTLAEIGGGSA